jgi:hypothetical protein
MGIKERQGKLLRKSTSMESRMIAFEVYLTM